MDPAMLEGFSDEDKAKMMGMIEAMQTRDRCVGETSDERSDETRDKQTTSEGKRCE
jgi:hypothetical protein